MAAMRNDGKRNSSGRFRTCLEVVKNRGVEPMKADSLDIFIWFAVHGLACISVRIDTLFLVTLVQPLHTRAIWSHLQTRGISAEVLYCCLGGSHGRNKRNTSCFQINSCKLWTFLTGSCHKKTTQYLRLHLRPWSFLHLPGRPLPPKTILCQLVWLKLLDVIS